MTLPISPKLGLIHRLGICSMVVPMSLPVAAQSTWNGTTNVNWSDATNWNPGIPAEGANLIIADNTGNGLTLDDGSHTVGMVTVGTSGTRTSGFTLNTTGANALTISGGVVANGNFTGGIGARFRGHTVISADQTWLVGGEAGNHAADRGIAFNEIAGAGAPGSVVLNGAITKTGPGQLTIGAVAVTGDGDINVNDGSLKLNAGGSQPLTIGTDGNGEIIVNNSASLIFSQNSGTFHISRPIRLNNTSNVVTGSGSNDKTGIYDIASDIEWNGFHNVTNNRNNNNTANVDFRFTGVMSGSGSITKNGDSQWILAGTEPNTFSGSVTVAGGELRLEKTGAIAIPGNVLVTGGALRMVNNDQLSPTSSITVTGGGIPHNAGRTQTLSSLSVSSTGVVSLSGFDVTGATVLSQGTHEVNSGHSFATHSLEISNNAAMRFVASNETGVSSANIGAGGLNLATGRVLLGNPGGAGSIEVNLGGDLVSTGTSLFTAANQAGPRLIDLQSGSRSFSVNDGTLTLGVPVRNGTLVKSGDGTLVLSAPGSTADFELTGGSVLIEGEVDAGDLTLSAGNLFMDVSGPNPAKLTTADFSTSGGFIDVSATEGPISPGSVELVRYTGTLTGTPVVNIPGILSTSRMAPVVNFGSGSDSAITLTTTALPADLTWHGGNGGVWETDGSANFNGGGEKFFSLDSVTFGDSAFQSVIQLNSVVTPTDVLFDHGDTVPTYTVSGTGSISGTTKLTKNGTGTTILATDNDYSGGTDILEGTLRIGSGGFTGGLGSGPVFVEFGATLAFARDGECIVGNPISGTGDLIAEGPGTVVLTSNNDGFGGFVEITGGTLQLGDGGANGSLGAAPIDVASGATLAIRRSGTPTIPNSIAGDGSLLVIGGSPIITGYNLYTGGMDVTDGGVVRAPGDASFGDLPLAPVPDAIRLEFGGLKNQDTFTEIDSYRGVTVSGEAYFTAGWNKSLAIGGPISGNGDIFINHDSGRVIFRNPDSDWNGVLTIGANKPGFSGNSAGILEIDTITDGGVAGPLGIASSDPANIVFDGGRLAYMGDDASTNRGFTLQGAGTLEVHQTLEISGTITGPGTLTKVALGTVVLSGDSDFTGNVTVDNGTLSVTHSNALGDPEKTLIIAGDAANNRIPEVQLSGGINPTVNSLQISGAGVDNLSGALRNLSGDNTLNVTTQVIMRTGNGSTTLYSDAGTLTLNSPLISPNTTNRQLFLDGPGDGVINGVIANGSTANLPVTKNGTGTWTLNGAHTYTGATTVNEGVLSLGQAALADESNVIIGENGVLHLDFNGTDRVGSLTIGAEGPLPDGVYSAATHPGFITGTGSLRVGEDPNPSGYSTWAAGFPFTPGVNDGENDDADGDGIPNLLEYVLGGIPAGAGAADTSILPVQEVTDDHVVFVFRRSDISESDVTLKVQWSDTLGGWNDFATIGAASAPPAVEVTEDSPSADLDTVTVRVPRNLSASGKLFVRLHAVK